MDAGSYQWQKKYGENLRVDAFSDLLFRHAHPLHNIESGLVLITFRYLFVIDDQNSGKNKDDSKTTKNIFNYLKNNKIPNSIAQNNTLVFEENNLKFKTYTPNINSKNDNDTSIITLLSYKDFDMLFMADAGVKSFENIKKNLNNNDIEILKSGHHGADNTVSKSMLKSINPDAAIISTGFNPYGHPSKQTLKTFETAKIKTYRTDIDNAIKITSDGNSYEIYRYNTNSKKFEKDMQNLCVNPQSR